MHKTHIQLSPTDHQHLKDQLSKGILPARSYKRATALLALHQGQTLKAVCHLLHWSYPTVMTLRDKYQSLGLACLQDKARSGRPLQLAGVQLAQITALACSTPPVGYARWSLRLLADKAVELAYVPHLSHTKVGSILKKTTSSLT
jgi:transposase